MNGERTMLLTKRCSVDLLLGTLAIFSGCCSALDVRPIVYVHIPKCGSSFATLLVQYSCPDYPKNLTVQEPTFFIQENDVDRLCPGAFARFESGHAPLKPEEAVRTSGHTVTVLRNAQERIASGFLHHFHDCTEMENEYFNGKDATQVYSELFRDQDALDSALRRYFACVEGCATRMLIGLACGGPRPLSGDEMLQAATTLRHFGFVGLTEDWDRTVRLWKAMFGGSYGDAVLTNNRPSKHAVFKNSLRSRIEQLGLHDTADSFIYDIARQWFHEKNQQYLS